MNSTTNLIRKNFFSFNRTIHTTFTSSSPRGLVKSSNRWGNFHRIGPASLATVDVRQMPRRPIPGHILQPPYAEHGTSSVWSPEIPVNTEIDIAYMRDAGKLAKEILALGSTLCKVKQKRKNSYKLLSLNIFIIYIAWYNHKQN